MRVPKDIADKMERYTQVRDEADKLYEELESWFSENADIDGIYITDFGVAKEPLGCHQGDGEYCDQYMHGEDTGSGVYYHEIEGDSRYAYYGYSF